MTELEGKNSLLGTDLVYKTDQQQLIQGTVRQETCTQENCITVERENYLGARDGIGFVHSIPGPEVNVNCGHTYIVRTCISKIRLDFF